MKLGIAGIRPEDKNKVLIAKEIGYDFIESGLAGLSSYETDAVKDFGDFLDSIGMPCVSTNGMFPGDIKLIGPGVQRAKIEDYLCAAFEKIKPLKTSVCVLGSGGARRVPDGYSVERAYDEFAELCSEVIAPIIEKYQKTLAIEPLNYSECNIVNTVADSMSVVKAVGKPSVMTLIDLYHVCYNGEDIETFAQYSGYIKHVHVASFNNHRRFPRPYDGEDYKGFFDVLRRARYADENVSIEAAVIDDGEIAFRNAALSSYSMLKSL